jgi:hypothetical protein
MQVPARVQSTADSVITTVDSLSAFAIPTRVENRCRRWEETQQDGIRAGRQECEWLLQRQDQIGKPSKARGSDTGGERSQIKTGT